MDDFVPIEILCPRCSAPVAASDQACPKCGTPFAPKPDGRSAQSGNKPKLEERRWVVISLMVFAALFLAFPFLWRSREFSLGGKVFWTIVVSIESVLIFWAFFLVMKYCYDSLRQSLG